MTITDLLQDLEAKAKQAIVAIEQHPPGFDAIMEYREATHPDRIPALVAYVRTSLTLLKEGYQLPDLTAASWIPWHEKVGKFLAGHLDAEEEK